MYTKFETVSYRIEFRKRILKHANRNIYLYVNIIFKYDILFVFVIYIIRDTFL